MESLAIYSNYILIIEWLCEHQSIHSICFVTSNIISLPQLLSHVTKMWNDRLQLKQAGLSSCLIEAEIQNNRLVTAQADRYFIK